MLNVQERKHYDDKQPDAYLFSSPQYFYLCTTSQTLTQPEHSLLVVFGCSASPKHKKICETVKSTENWSSSNSSNEIKAVVHFYACKNASEKPKLGEKEPENQCLCTCIRKVYMKIKINCKYEQHKCERKRFASIITAYVAFNLLFSYICKHCTKYTTKCQWQEGMKIKKQQRTFFKRTSGNVNKINCFVFWKTRKWQRNAEVKNENKTNMSGKKH